MSTISLPPRSMEQQHVRVSTLGVLRSEWTKTRSLRSTVWTLATVVFLMLGLSALFSAVTASQYSGFDAAQKAQFDPIGVSLSGVTFAQLAIGVLGVLVMSGEYTTGMIRASLTAVPRRLPVLWGKIAVFSAVAFVVTLVTSFGTFFLGQSILHGQGLDVALSSPGALRSVIGATLALTVSGVIGLALGALIRSSAGAISIFVGVFFVLTPLAGLLPSSISDHLVKYLPAAAGGALYGGDMGVPNPLSPWAGFAVLCGYAVLLVAAAAFRLRRTDA